jgi:hypothetical protein
MIIMTSLKSGISFLFVVFALQASSANAFCIFSDDYLWSMASGGRSVGLCRIVPGDPGTFCDLYVKAGNLGYPQSTAGGTGCVKTPDFPKRMNVCWYDDPRYSLTAAERADFCTPSGKHNAVAQVCHALMRGLC